MAAIFLLQVVENEASHEPYQTDAKLQSCCSVTYSKRIQCSLKCIYGRGDGFVSTVTTLRAGETGGLNPDRGSRHLSPPKLPDHPWGSNPLLFNGYRGSFQEVKLPRYCVDHSRASNAEVTNKWIYTSTLTICFHGVESDKINFSSIHIPGHNTVYFTAFHSGRLRMWFLLF